jgi:hypothetical protein
MFYGVLMSGDSLQFHKIQFDEYLFRTIPGNIFIKTGKIDPSSNLVTLESRKTNYQNYFSREAIEIRGND